MKIVSTREEILRRRRLQNPKMKDVGIPIKNIIAIESATVNINNPIKDITTYKINKDNKGC